METVHTVALTTFDSDDLQAKLRHFGDYEHNQLTKGSFRGRLTRSHIDDIVMDMVNYSQDVLVRGSYPEDRITLGLMLSSRDAGLFNGFRFARQDAIIVSEGCAMDGYLQPSGSHLVGFQLSRDEFERQGVAIPGRSEFQIYSRSSPEMLELNRYVRELVTYSLTSNPVETIHALVVKDDLSALFRRAIDSSAHRENRVHSLDAEKRSSVLRNLEEYIEFHLTSDIRIPHLCAHLGVSQKSLEVLCSEVFGMPPRRYLTLKRLNAARKALIRAKHYDSTVAAVAGRAGFKHLGRFSSTYHSFFGELPSHTLRNR